MIDVTKIIRFNDTIPKSRVFNFTPGDMLLDNSICADVGYTAINTSNSATFYLLRQLCYERFYDSSITSLSGLAYFSIPTKYLGIGCSGNDFIVNTSKTGIQFSYNVNLSNTAETVSWSSASGYVMSDMGVVVVPVYNYDSSLISYWKFNEIINSTTASDSAPNPQTLVADVSVSFSGGFVNNGAYFSATGSLSGTSIGNKLKLNTSAFSISVLVNPNITTQQYIFEGNTGKPLFFISNSPLRASVTMRNNGDSGFDTYASSPLATVSTGVWTHIGVSYDGSNVTFVRNGVVNSSSARTGSMGGSEPSSITVGGRSTVFFSGGLDELKIYNRALTPQEWLQVYQTSVYSLTGNTFSLSATTLTPYNELNLYATVNSNELNRTTNPSAFNNYDSLSSYKSTVSNKYFGPMVTKILYLDENMQVVASAAPSRPIKKHDKIPTTFVTKIIL